MLHMLWSLTHVIFQLKMDWWLKLDYFLFPPFAILSVVD
jgi:hypothetical protein